MWYPSKVTLEAYRRMRSVSDYTPELDIVVVAPDGTFAAYCICWLDPVNKIGEFEPVGTRETFRGKGLGKAVMLCQGQLTFDPVRQLEMDPPIQYSEKESVFLAANLQPRSSVQQWRRKVYHLKNMVSRSLRSLDTMFFRWFEKRAHCLFEKNRGLFFRARR